MDYIKLFYWLSVADNARTLFVVFIIIFTLISIISTIFYFFYSNTGLTGQTRDDEKNQRMARKWMWYNYPFMILFWSLFVFTPTKRDSLFIVAGGTTLNYLSKDSTAKELPKDLLNFISDELRRMAAEAKVNINVSKTKEDMINEAKKLSSDELLEKMKSDSILRNLLLNKK